MPQPDISWTNHGSICIVIGATPEGIEWLEMNLDSSVFRWGANGFAVEPRYVSNILQGAHDDGLEIQL